MHQFRLAIGTVALGITVVAMAAGPAHADAVKCKATITKAASQYVQARTKALVKCETSVVAGKLPMGTDCSNEMKTDTAIDKAKAKMEAAIEKACGGADKECGAGGDDDSLTSIGWNVGVCPDIERQGCSMAIDDCHDVSECLECIESEAVDQAVKLYYDDLVLPSTTDKTRNKCQQTIGKASAAFLAAKTKALAKCWDAVNKGVIVGPCPLPGDGKAAGAIAAAEAKKIAAICKACGGSDKGCDQTVTSPSNTIPGTGGNDDLMPAAIGFPANCDDLTIPGGASCGQAVNTLADLVECVDCITEFKVDCADRAAVPWAGSYPGECNPGCGNNLLEPGEVCDGNDSAACPGHCAPALVAEACTCPSGTFSMDGIPGADLDTGWTGIAHNQGALSGHIFDADTYGCSSGGPDTTCSFVARYSTPYFGAPLPLSSGGVPICAVNELAGPTVGTLNLTSGDLTYDYSLISRVFAGIAADQPCPRCDGDPIDDDGVKGGTCNGGEDAGAPCDVDGVSASFGKTSFDCFPTAGSNIGNLKITFDDATTGTKTVTTSPASPNCTGVGGGKKCFCDTCNNIDASPCMTNADCPLSGGNPGICGGKRCLTGVNAGAPCSATSECPASDCQRPGQATKPNGCVDDTAVAGDGTICADAGGNEGYCSEGPTDNNCAPPEQFRGCTSVNAATDCPLTGVCLSAPRPCFLSTVTRTGTPGPTGGAYAGTFCISPTTAASVNNVAGLPGLGALILPYTLSVNVP
jgi:hypothetical protein